MVPRASIGEFFRVFLVEYLCMLVVSFWYEFLPRFFLLSFQSVDSQLLSDCGFSEGNSLPDFIARGPTGDGAYPEGGSPFLLRPFWLDTTEVRIQS